MFGAPAKFSSYGIPVLTIQKLFELHVVPVPIVPAWLIPNLMRFRAPSPVSGTKTPDFEKAKTLLARIAPTPNAASNTLERLIDVFPNLIDSLPDAVFVKDLNGHWLIANKAAIQLFKLHDIDWKGKTSSELISTNTAMSDKLSQCLAYDETAWNTGKVLAFEEQRVDNENIFAEYEINKTPLLNENGERKALLVICRNVTAIKRAEHELRIAEIAIESQEAIVITDANNHILRVNKAFTQLTGYSPEEVIGKKPSILKSSRHNKAFYRAIRHSLRNQKYWQGEIWDRRKNGELYPRWVTITGVTQANGEVSNYVGAISNIVEHKGAEEEIHRLAFYDPLTDLPNRRLLNDRLQQALTASCCNNDYGAVLLIDLDHFKTINDSKGHEIGDKLLVEVAKRLQSCTRQCDTVARLGGDEFVIMLEGLNPEADQAVLQAEAVGEKVLKTINQSYSLADYELFSSTSIGICLFKGDTISASEILKRADAAMYQAKNADRNTLRFFDPSLQAILETRLNLKSELHHALIQDQLRLYYQIQIDSSGQVFGAEALVRWQHPERGLIYPSDFISIAEESGLILPIGDWVLQTACAQLKRWENNPLTQNLVLAVNVSPLQFRQTKFVDHISKIIEQTEINTRHLKLELTESMVITDINDTIKKMQQLKQLGISFSMDDFGTGYSSLSCLKKLPFSQLKIDQSFVRDIVTDPCDAAIVQTILGMAQTLGLNVIAEGVENEKQYASLESRGCPAYQGYLFGKAMPADELENLISQITQARKVRTEQDWVNTALIFPFTL